MFCQKSNRKSVLRVTAITLSASLLGGCASLDALTFSSANGSGVSGPTSATLNITDPINANETPDNQALIGQARLDIDGFEDAFNANCQEEGAAEGFGVSALLAVLAPVVIDSVVSEVSDELKSAIQELVEKGKHSYSASVFFDDPSKFAAGSQCLVLIRTHGDDNPRITFTHIAKIEPIGSERGAFRVLPVQLWLKEAVALTSSGEGVDIGVAFSASAVRPNKGGFAKEEFATESYAFKGIRPGSAALTDRALPAGTDLMRGAPSDAIALQIKLAIAEEGIALPDAKAAGAEVDALAEALGPFVKEQLKAGLSNE